MSLKPGSQNDLPPAARSRVVETFNKKPYIFDSVINQDGNLSLRVPDHQYARQLVTGSNPVLGELFDSRLKQDQQNNLHSDHVEFVVLDLTQPAVPQEIINRALTAYPEITSGSGFSAKETFTDKYPGKVFVVIGAEAVPAGSSQDYLMSIALKAPTIFIASSQINHEIEHPKYTEAVGDSVSMTINLE